MGAHSLGIHERPLALAVENDLFLSSLSEGGVSIRKAKSGCLVTLMLMGVRTMQFQKLPKFQQHASIYRTVVVLREASTLQLTASWEYRLIFHLFPPWNVHLFH